MGTKDVICVDICFARPLFALFHMFRVLGGAYSTISRFWPCIANNTFIPVSMDHKILLHKDCRKVVNRSVSESRMYTSSRYGGGGKFEHY